MRVRSSSAFLVCLAPIALLVGCVGQAPAQSDLVSRLQSLPGVASVDYVRAGGVVTPAEHRLTIVLDARLADADAREIAHTTCDREVEIGRLTVTTDADISAPGAVFDVRSSYSLSPCIAESDLIGFARASAAMQELGADYDGRFGVFLDDPRESEPAESVVQVSTATTERNRLVDALRALDGHLRGLAFDFEGEWDENGEDDPPGDSFLTARLAAEDDIDRMLPIITRAQELDVGDIAIDDDSMSVELRPESATDAQVILTALADSAGISLEVVPAP